MSIFSKGVAGVDVGGHGAIFFHETDEAFSFAKYSDAEIARVIRARLHHTVVFYVERVSERPNEANQFKFGYNCGKVYGILVGLATLIYFVEPLRWQTSMGVASSRPPDCKHGEFYCCDDCAYANRKRRFKTAAQALRPNIKVTLDNADAILIGIYGHRKESGYEATHQTILRPGSGLVVKRRERT